MRSLAVAAALLPLLAPLIQGKAGIFTVPAELRSDRFILRIDNHPAYVAHAATTYYFANFELEGSVEISVTAPSDDYWAKGVEVQPWRWGIRPVLKGRTITFPISQPMKLSISRPGDHGAGAEMLFLFANSPELNPPPVNDRSIHYFAPGVYHQNIDVESGGTVYLAPGAIVFGAINIWAVKDVKIFGLGTVVYDGPQDPDHDQGWMHRPNWHVIVMDHARHIHIHGITCVVRSRTWMIQMLGSRDVVFDNVKVIGGCPGNANQDGMDWLGGGDTVVRDCFFRASDDIFAIYGNWLGYTEKALATPGEDVNNIVIENSVLSTSISNVVRVSWPRKISNSNHFAMRNSDVIHMGMGGCQIPFGLLEIWDDPAGHGRHTGYSFENIRLEDWYSLMQLRQQQPAIRNVKFSHLWAIETPSLVPSVLSGDVSGVTLDGVKIVNTGVLADEDVPIKVLPGTDPTYRERVGGLRAAFTYSAGPVKPGEPVEFNAAESRSSNGGIATYEWLFGDGTRVAGKMVQHVFPDPQGTLWDGSGRFRVLLKVTDSNGHSDWTYRPVVVSNSYDDAVTESNLHPGLSYAYYEGSWPTVPDFHLLSPATIGRVSSLSVLSRKSQVNYAFVFEGYLDVPLTGGYTFLLLSNDGGRIEIDSRVVAASPASKAQVCGSVGNMVQLATGSIGLSAGKHKIRISMTHTTGPDGFAVKWEGPGVLLSDIPTAALASSCQVDDCRTR